MTTNVLLTNAEISNEALRILSNNLVFSKRIKNNYSDKFGQGGNKIGDTYSLRLPVKYRFSNGSALDVQGVAETSVPLVLNNWVQRAVQVSTQDMVLSMDLFSDRVLKTAMVSAANQIDKYNLDMAVKALFTTAGTPGTTPSSAVAMNELLGEANNKVFNNLAPDDMLTLISDGYFSQKAAALNTNVFNGQPRIADQNLKGWVTDAFGSEWFKTQMMPTHTNGTFSGTPEVDVAGQSGSTLNTKSWGAGSTVTVGTVFTIDGVYAVNGQTKQAYDYLQEFVVTEASGASTTKALKISPALIGPEDPQNQNVSALPADEANLNIKGASAAVLKQAMVFAEDAFGVAYAQLEIPAGMGVKSTRSVDSDTGVGIQYTAGYNIQSMAEIHRLDLLSGFVAQYGQLGARIFY